MDNLNDLKAIWHTAKTDKLPSSSEMLQLIGTFRRQKLRNKWGAIVGSIFFSCLILVVLVAVDFRLLTTYVGGALMILSGVLIAVSNIRSLKRFNQLLDCSNLEFLAFIDQTHENQAYYYKKTMVRIISICSVGWLLYLYEPIHRQSLWLIGVYYVIALTYLGVLWFVVRPRTFRKHTLKLEATKKRFENISKQLN